MSMRRTIILEEMFKQVATPKELHKYNELYEKRNKGSATVLALRVIKEHWDVMIAKLNKQVPLSDVVDTEVKPRMIKINQGGSSWYQKL